MPTVYPGAVDTFPTNLNVPDVALAKVLRDMQDAIVMLETEGGGGAFAFTTFPILTSQSLSAALLPGTLFQIDAGGGNLTVTLPALSAATRGRLTAFQRFGSGVETVTIQAFGSDLIDGTSSSIALANHDDTVVLCPIFDWFAATAEKVRWRVLWRRVANPLTALPVLAAPVSAYTVTDQDYLVAASASGGAFTVTLPTAVGRAGRVFVVKKTDASANAVTLDGDGSETIDGAATYALTAQWQTVRVISTNSAWLTI